MFYYYYMLLNNFRLFPASNEHWTVVNCNSNITKMQIKSQFLIILISYPICVLGLPNQDLFIGAVSFCLNNGLKFLNIVFVNNNSSTRLLYLILEKNPICT